jgi:hypothetical protein
LTKANPWYDTGMEKELPLLAIGTLVWFTLGDHSSIRTGKIIHYDPDMDMYVIEIPVKGEKYTQALEVSPEFCIAYE